MAMTFEQLNEQFAGKEEDLIYLNMQAVLGTEEEGAKAWETGEFKCINWFDCQFCPAFDPNYCL